MEYLEGETLAKRLERGALPLAEALTIAIQMASALDTAHRAGITHRDIKPANIFLTKNGAKLLDFGLAKTGGAVLAAAGLSTFPTMAPAPTAQGTILGTFQYMAPEQLEAKEADARTDIFAFGAVLYEMLTGTKAFAGKSQASLIAAILAQQPAPPSALQPLTPPALDRLVAVCLAKDPDERWQSAADLGRQLKGIAEDRSQGQLATPAPGAVRRRTVNAPSDCRASPESRVSWWHSLAGGRSASVPRAVEPQIVTVGVPKPNAVAFLGSPDLPFALSPDGSAVVYAGRNPDEKRLQTHLWVRSLNTLTPRELPGTEDARQPFFSPDGRWVGFFTPDGKLKKVPVAGGNCRDPCGARSTGAPGPSAPGLTMARLSSAQPGQQWFATRRGRGWRGRRPDDCSRHRNKRTSSRNSCPRRARSSSPCCSLQDFRSLGSRPLGSTPKSVGRFSRTPIPPITCPPATSCFNAATRSSWRRSMPGVWRSPARSNPSATAFGETQSGPLERSRNLRCQ